MPSYYDYDDYHSVAEDSDELYSYDDESDYDQTNQSDWENYYHNIANDIVEE